MNKTKLIILIAIIAILVSGCVQEPKQEVTPTATSTPPPAPKLKIMSVTLGQATAVQAPMTIKVKNIGNATAKDVYVGGVKVYFIPKYGNFTNRSGLIEDSITHFLKITIPAGLVSYTFDTGIPNPEYNTSDSCYDLSCTFKNLTVSTDAESSSPDYLGDILPGEVKEGHITLIISSTSGDYIYNKVAWTDDKKEYAIY